MFRASILLETSVAYGLMCFFTLTNALAPKRIRGFKHQSDGCEEHLKYFKLNPLFTTPGYMMAVCSTT